MSNISKRRREGSRTKIKSMGDHKEFLKRITKTLYYGQLPTLPCLSLPVTEISCSLWSVSQRGRSLRRLHADAAAGIARSACVSPCALVLAVLYLERLRLRNPDYIAHAAPADLFLVSLMVSNKFLQDDGEDDDVVCSEWAASGGIELAYLKKLEVEFLNAIDWNIFVSDKSFEAGLTWLEREVALRQAARHGFFTYGDLTAGCDVTAVTQALSAAAAAAAAAVAAYVAALTTLLAAALLVSHCLPARPLRSNDTNIITHDLASDLTPSVNVTVDPVTIRFLEDDFVPAPECCTEWARYRESTTAKRNWYDAIVVYDWRSSESWWSTTSVLNWLYQSSLITPMQRWLEQLERQSELVTEQVSRGRCEPGGRGEPGERCQWLNLSRLGALAAARTDR